MTAPYTEYLNGQSPVPIVQEADPDFTQNVIVMPVPHEDSWCALWAIDGDGAHEHFYGEKAAAVEWAIARATNDVRVWSDELQDLELLHVEE